MKWLKRIGIGLGVLVVLVLGLAAYMELKPAKARAIDPNKKFEATAARLQRGEYIVEAVVGCMECHSERDWKTHGAPELAGMVGGGWDVPYEENHMPGKVYASNISSDPEHGIGAWSDDEIARAIREGVSRDGKPLFMMPYQAFHNMSDEEVASVVVYLRTVKPVKNKQERTEIIVPVRWFMKGMTMPITEPRPEADVSTPEKRGKHLVDVSGCFGCHTPVNERHEFLPGMDWAGGQEFRGPWGLTRSANLTPDASGIAHYDEALFIRTMRTGNIGGRRLSPLMSWNHFRKMTDEDLKAIWAFLRTVKPVANDVKREPVPEMKDNPEVNEHPEAVAAEGAGAMPAAAAPAGSGGGASP
jgi:mono/diheme cytochrome c family protein